MPARLSLLACVAAAAVVCRCVRPVRADETVRQVQEELRKRNLYFGDMDGRASPAALRRPAPLPGAQGLLLHRRARRHPVFPASRNPAAPARLAAGREPGRHAAPADARDGAPLWPDITVLRSDEAPPDARRPVEADDSAHAVPTATPAPAARRPPASLHRPTLDEVRAFLTRYLQAGQTNDSRGEMAFYGDRVDYFDEGIVDRPFIARDVTRYDHRWPERQFHPARPADAFRLARRGPGQGRGAFSLRFHE